MGNDFLEIQASGAVARPIAEVRAQYRDIDHHIRHNVHPGIQFAWVDGDGGKRLVRTEFRLLGMLNYDITEFVDAPDGTLLIHHLEGANTGTIIEHHFRAIDDGNTQVDLVARVPASTGRKLLGPLFRFGVRQILMKALGEDKRDLEGKGYRVGAAGNVEAAVAHFVDGEVSAAAVSCVFRAACLTCVADGAIDVAERDAIERALAAMKSEGVYDAAAIDAELAAALRVTDGDVATHAMDLGRELAKANVAPLGLAVATIVAAVSSGISYPELGVLRKLAEGAGMPDAVVESTADRVEAALNARS